MTIDSDQLAGTIVADPSTEGRFGEGMQVVQPPAQASWPARSVYLAAARALLPRWLHIVGTAPWNGVATRSARAASPSASTLYHRQTATLAIALLASQRERSSNAAYLRECVRASLIGWQLSLRSDGRPVARKTAGSPLQMAICQSVVHLLTETTGFQTTALLEDVHRHVRWLGGRPRTTPWLEAAAICALSDAAVLCRDASLLGVARKRLTALLESQSIEGWFPERGGADIGRLSLTVDSLARCYQLSGWCELTEPLCRAMHFLLHFVHPDGRCGGYYGSCETAFLSPYGVELLAPTFADAARLALVCRRRFARLAAGPFCGWHGDLCSVLGAGVALAAANATPTLNLPAVEGKDHPTFDLRPSCTTLCSTSTADARETLPHSRIGETHFPHAGLSIFSTKAYYAVVAGRKGGALHVTWRTADSSLDDPGVAVVFNHAIRTSSRQDSRSRCQTSPGSVTSSGILSSSERSSDRPGRWIRRLLRRAASFTRPYRDATVRERAHHDDSQPPVGNRYHREITFGEDTIRIRDVVRCRLPCRAIVCQSPPPDAGMRRSSSHYLIDVLDTDHPPRPPIFVDGGRRVEITRVYRNGNLVDRDEQ